jgi:hypothetical protein
LQGTYGLRWYSALWRLIVLSLFAQFTIIVWAGFLTWMAEI